MKLLITTFSNSRSIDLILKKTKFDKIIIFTSKEFKKKAQKYLSNKKGVVKIINPFEVNNIILKIVNYIKKNPGEYTINITEGTNIMAAATLSAAYYLGINAVYVSKDNILQLPIPNVGYKNQITKKSKFWLKRIKEKLDKIEDVSQVELAGGVQAQRLTVPLRILESSGLIKRELKNGKKFIQLTEAGRIIVEMGF